VNLSNADYHNLIFDVKRYYAALRLKKQRLKIELREVEATIRDIEYRHKMKRED